MRLIDADALIKALNSNCKPELCHDYKTAWCVACCPHNDFVDLLDDAPTVEERPHGEWIDKRTIEHDGEFYCSNCDEVAELLDGGSQFLSKFCPNCGADMRGGAE